MPYIVINNSRRFWYPIYRSELLIPSTFIPSSQFCKSYSIIIWLKLTRKSFQLIVWLVPSLTVDVISVTIIGVLLGPMFPIAVNHAARVLPRHLVNGAVGWIAACGAGGSALLPFLTGTIASNLGIESLQPLCVLLKPAPIPEVLPDSTQNLFFFRRLLAMLVVLGFVWGIVPKGRKTTLVDFWKR